MALLKSRRHIAMIGALAALPLAGLAVPSLAQGSLAMLDTLDDGAWEIRFRNGTPPRQLCVRSGREFIQLRHSESGCNRFVVEDGREEVTVQYTCPGNGFGRTNIRKEGSGLVQIDTQGIVDGRPFQFSAEARRIGPCR